MKSILTVFIIIGLTNSYPAEEVIGPSHFYGAWSTEITNEGTQYTCVKIYTPKYFIYSVYTVETKKFIAAGGGTWEMTNKGINETYEFNTTDPNKIGTTQKYTTSDHDEDLMTTESNIHGEVKTQSWIKLDNGNSPLFGTWRITERERNGEMSTMTMGPRKTLKILSGKHFQWAAFNVETKQFFGTGGGTFTTTSDKYTEHIEFFSRDNNRVGASLEFDYSRKEQQWHHKGLSSKGNPIYEIWTLQDVN